MTVWRSTFGHVATGASVHTCTGMRIDCVYETTNEFVKQTYSMAILKIGSRGLLERGFLNPLLEYAVRNGTEAEALTMSESI